MALTNALLKSMGIEGDQRDQIMAAHQETLQSIKDERDGLRDTAARVPALEREIEDLKAAQPTEDWEARYNAEHEAFEAFKAKSEKESADKEKADLYRSLLLEQGIDPKRVDSIMRVTDLGEVSVKDGQLEGSEKLAESIKSEWADFVVKEITRGASVDDPPGGGGTGRTRDEIMAIKDTAERQQAIADNPELFGLA